MTGMALGVAQGAMASYLLSMLTVFILRGCRHPL